MITWQVSTPGDIKNYHIHSAVNEQVIIAMYITTDMADDECYAAPNFKHILIMLFHNHKHIRKSI